MLPGRFVHRADKPRKIISARPSVEEMQKDSGNQGEDAESHFCVKKLLLKIAHQAPPELYVSITGDSIWRIMKIMNGWRLDGRFE